MLQYWLHVICDTLCYAFSQTDFTFEASATRRTAMQQLLLVILLIDGSTRAYSSWPANSNGLMAEIFIVLTGVQVPRCITDFVFSSSTISVVATNGIPPVNIFGRATIFIRVQN
jgi:hypothetical protein